MHLLQGWTLFLGILVGSAVWITHADLGVGDCMVLLFLAAALLMGVGVAAILRRREKNAAIIDLLPQSDIVKNFQRVA
jgi:hypothetical protein